MKWNKYTLKTTTEAIDYISGLMIELGWNTDRRQCAFIRRGQEGNVYRLSSNTS